MSLRSHYCAAQPFPAFVRDTGANADLWQIFARRTEVPTSVVERVQAMGGHWHLLVIAEDWCGDAVNSLPVLARLAQRAENLDLRVMPRDAHSELMDAHRSPRGGLAIPVVLVLDADCIQQGWWGSRPAELQRWMDEVGSSMQTEARYREVRRGYARDRRTPVLDDVVGLLAATACECRAA